MRHRIILIALASIGFLVTFTIRSWHAGLWPRSEPAGYASVSAPRLPTARLRMAVASSPFESTPPLAPATMSTVASIDAPDYLGERAREASHSGRMR